MHARLLRGRHHDIQSSFIFISDQPAQTGTLIGFSVLKWESALTAACCCWYYHFADEVSIAITDHAYMPWAITGCVVEYGGTTACCSRLEHFEAFPQPCSLSFVHIHTRHDLYHCFYMIPGTTAVVQPHELHRNKYQVLGIWCCLRGYDISYLVHPFDDELFCFNGTEEGYRMSTLYLVPGTLYRTYIYTSKYWCAMSSH